MDQIDRRVEVTQAAGLVLVNPYFELLFARLGIIDKDGRIGAGHIPTARAVLNKISPTSPSDDPIKAVLLGVALDDWTEQGIGVLPEGAATTIETMLQALIKQCPAFDDLPTASFVETFVDRAGKVSFDPSGTQLLVERGPFDMLLQQVPWAYETVRLPWMSETLSVTW